MLEAIRQTNSSQISVYDCVNSSGKVEAVRQAVNHLYTTTTFDYIGFLDADLLVNLDDFTELIEALVKEPSLEIVCGSRAKRLGAATSCNLKRHTISRSLVPVTFAEKFRSAWLFDVEMFTRIKQYYGVNRSMEMIVEFPLVDTHGKFQNCQQ